MIQLIISGEVSEEYVFFTDLYQRYQRLMYSVAKRYAASENEAEDIMQDAVERLLKRIPKLMELPGCTLPTFILLEVPQSISNGIKMSLRNTRCRLTTMMGTHTKSPANLHRRFWNGKNSSASLLLSGIKSRGQMRNCSIASTFSKKATKSSQKFITVKRRVSG